MRWLVLVTTLAVAGCQKPCSASNCDGCCADTGECVEGTTRFECGVGGVACVRCSSQERCVAARCEANPVIDAGVVDAGPQTCSCATACCLPDGSCAPNNDPAACGPARAFCGTCGAGLRCELGVCVGTSCGGCFDGLGVCRPGTATTACGSDAGLCSACLTDQACSAGTCVFTRCDSSNCRFGCCQPDLRCETAIGAAACGLNGDACQTCGAMQLCIGGTCQ